MESKNKTDGIEDNSSKDHPEVFPLRDLYEDWIGQDLDYIKFLHSETKVFQELREKHQDNWEIVELCREALFDNSRLIKNLTKEADDVREKIRRLGKV